MQSMFVLSSYYPAITVVAAAGGGGRLCYRMVRMVSVPGVRSEFDG
jgi:hypothetical protein